MAANSTYIKNIWRLYGVTNNNGAVSASGRTLFTDNTNVNSLPLWLMLETANSVPAVTTVKAYVDGVEQTQWVEYDANFVSTDWLLGSNGYRIVQIETLPAGEVTLEFDVGSVKTETVTIQYDPAPAIRIKNLYNGQKFTDEDGLANEDIAIQLVNFDTAGLETITVTINGETFQVNNATHQTELEFDTSVKLVPGPNTIVVAGTAFGVPVTTTITVFYFSELEPKIYNFLPVPVDAPDDADGRIVRQGTSNQYVTEEESIDVLFNADDFDSLHISLDGTTFVEVTVDTGNNNSLNYTAGSPNEMTVEQANNSVLDFIFRLNDIQWPDTGGSVAITFAAKRGAVTVTHTITVTRVVPAYRVKSPKLPEEQVVKQNFVDVVIYAPGADRIEINKEVMTADSLNPYYFRHRVTGLKVGRNTIKFTVYRGDQSVPGEFSVTYAADYKVGAQYVTELPSSGKISVFGGDLQLTFPKNTYLRPAQATPHVDSLFDSQPILFGIADADGRTIKTRNNNGVIQTIPTDTTARNLLAPGANFGFASKLYWIDPGYVDVGNPDNYRYYQGDHPYADTTNSAMPFNKFYNRDPVNHWLTPTQRGTITIKYDEQLRNEAASNLSIWRFNGITWVNLGGKVDTNKKTVTTTMDGFGYYAVMALRYSYNDIIGHDYARNAVEIMFARGIMEQKSANEFGVYDNISRGEFAQMLVKMLNLELDYDDNNLTFDDVPALKLPNTLWDYRYIETAVRKGIVRGRGPRLFLPNEPLTREEAAVMIARATNLLKGKEDPEKDLETLKKTFTDGGLISYYAASSVLAVYKAGFITGAPNSTTGNGKPTYRFDPHANLKRADAAVIAERVMRKNKLL